MPSDTPASPTRARTTGAATWVDEVDVDPQWSSPLTDHEASTRSSADPDDRQPSRRRWTPALVVTAVVVALALVVTGVWALGGFEKRTDLLSDRVPGEAIETGPYVFTFDSVTAQRTTDFNDDVVWKVVVNGTGRTTGDVSIAPPPSGDSAFFVSRDPSSGQIQQPYSQQIGEPLSITESASTFTPGLPPVPFEVEFRYDATYVPSSSLRFAAFQLRFIDSSLLGDQDKQWRRDLRSEQLDLPVTVLPEDTD